MKALNKIVALAALVCVPSIALADYPRKNHSDRYWSSGDSCPPRSSAYYSPTYYTPRPRDFNYSTGNYGWIYSNPRPRNHGNGSYGNSYAGGFDNAIRNGVRSGKLSNAEVHELRDDLRDIRRKEIRYRSDGYLSPRERDSLRDDVQDLRKDLKHELRDGERRW